MNFKKQKPLSGHIMALVCVIVWGSSFVVSKGLMLFLQPTQLMLLRFTLAYFALWVIHPKWHFDWKTEWQFLILAIFANTVYCWAENTAITLTQATNVSIIVSTSPIITALILPLFYKQEYMTKQQITGFAVSFIGVVLVVFNGTLTLKIQPLGDLLAFVASASWAVYGILLKRWAADYDGVLITRKLMFYGMITAFPLMIAEGHVIDFVTLFALENLAQLAYLGFVCSATCYILWGAAIQKLGVLTTNLYVNMIPLVTLLISAVVLDETITIMGLLGMILVIAGMIGATAQHSPE